MAGHKKWADIKHKADVGLSNSIFTIKPYKWNGCWVFDDERVGLVKEAFVCGADDLIDALIKQAHIPKAEKGFILQFSKQPFPDAAATLSFSRHEHNGTWYTCIGMKAWLCPALNLYYPRSPRNLYVAVKPLKE